MQTGGGVMSSDLRAWAATQPDVGFVDTIHELDGDRAARPPSVSRLGRHARRPEKHSVFPMLDRGEEAQVSVGRGASRGTFGHGLAGR